MITLGAYLKQRQPEQYRNWVTILMQHGYPIPRWSEYGGVTVVKESLTTEPKPDLTPFQRFLDRLMRRRPRPGRHP